MRERWRLAPDKKRMAIIRYYADAALIRIHAYDWDNLILGKELACYETAAVGAAKSARKEMAKLAKEAQA